MSKSASACETSPTLVSVRPIRRPVPGPPVAANGVPPESGATGRRDQQIKKLRYRRRPDTIDCFRESQSEAPHGGGLAPRALQRVRAYIDAHLSDKIELDVLARVATVSRCHFAREFRRSIGLPPMSYVMQRRLERALSLLTETDLPLRAIAVESGFSDQSHFSRRFRAYTGVTPRSVRWSHVRP
jgi:AraC-like DNA-binding protein